MKRLTFLLLVLFLTRLCFAGDAKLLAIRVSGSRLFTEDEVAKASGLQVNQEIGPAEFKNAADRLAATGAFSQVGYKYGPLGNGMFVEFEVEDAPEFLPVRYENLVWWSDDELTNALHQRVPLFHGRLPSGGGIVDQVTAAISALLTERGVNAQARMRLHSAGPGKPIDAVSFYVDGVTLPVKEINVVGTSIATEAQTTLKSLMDVGFDRAVVEDSARYKLQTLYRGKGFLKAQFDSPQVRLLGDPRNPQIGLTFHVQDGLQYHFGDLRFTGNSVIAEGDLRKFVANCARGEVANFNTLLFDLKAANDDYFKRGYMESKIQVTPTYDDSAKAVDYDLNVVEGRLFHMGRLEIAGLDPQTTEKLMGRWKLKPGDAYAQDYPPQFIRENGAVLHARPAKIIETNRPDATVDLRLEF